MKIVGKDENDAGNGDGTRTFENVALVNSVINSDSYNQVDQLSSCLLGCTTFACSTICFVLVGYVSSLLVFP